MLEKIYSDTGLLVNDVNFQPGINIILGKYSTDRQATGINGIGKSTLIRLINYVFLSNTAEAIFKNEKYDFLRKENHNIVLEFKIEGQSYAIKRFFNKEDKIYFGAKLGKLEEFTKSEVKSILTNKMFSIENNEVFFEGNRFGTLFHFFVKDDLEHQQRVDPLNFLPYSPNSRELAIYNFFLLNLPTKSLIQYNDLAIECDNSRQTINTLEDKILKETGKQIEEFKSERIKVEKNIALLEKSLKERNFLDNYKDIEKNLLEITAKINEKLKEYHSFDRKLNKIRESYQVNQEFDTLQVQKLYNESVATFGDLVKKKLDEIIQFKKEILENRNKFLIAKESQLQKIIENLLTEISVLENKRSEFYKKLDEKGALDSITNTYEQLSAERANLERNLQVLKQIDEIQNALGDLDIKISEIKRDILNDLKAYESGLNKLRSLFQEILKNAIFLGEDFSHAYFDISPITNSLRSQLPFKIKIEIPKADALGQTRLKIVAYDLMVFLNNILEKRRCPNFLIHDGVFHGIAKRAMINTLNFIYHQQLINHEFQYVVTFNEDEIEIPKDKESVYGKFEFELSKVIVAEYEDVPQKMIFKKAFA